MQNLNAQKHSNFEAFTSASYTIKTQNSLKVTVEIDAPEVVVMVAWGTSLDDTKLKVTTVAKTGSHPVDIPNNSTGKNIYIFTFLKPQKNDEDGNLWFGSGASSSGDSTTPVGMLRFPREPVAGVDFPNIPPANIPLPVPIKSNIPPEALSKEFSSYFSAGSKRYILNGTIQESAQILLLDMVGNSVNFYWSKEHQAGVSTSNPAYNSNKFVCLITATPPNPGDSPGDFNFSVGDPRKDAEVRISGM